MDWDAIKNEYIMGVGIKELAEKYDCPITDIYERALDENWNLKRDELAAAEIDLTEKQKIFADEYLIDFNATRAAIAAGYSEKSAEVIGWENLRKPKIIQYLQKRLASKQSDRIAKQDEILEFYTKSMRDPQISQKERRLAAEDLSKYYQMFNQKIEITTTKLEDLIEDV